jgi:hypothetical protein
VTLFLASTFVKGFPVLCNNGVSLPTYAQKIYFQEREKPPGGGDFSFISV